MNYDIITFMNLEDYYERIESIDLTKIDNIIYCNLTLKKQIEICPSCGSNESTVHGYYKKKITQSISTSSPCYIIYNARRYKCKFCSKVYYEENPFSTGKDQV